MRTSSASGTTPLDTIFMVATPENVAFDFRLAGPFHRLVAFVIDMMVIGTIVFIILYCMAMLGIQGVGLFLFFLFIVFWGYGGLMEAFWNGQTLGKRVMGIRVVSNSGLAINAGQAILRNILRSADLVPPFFPGVASMLISSQFQRLGDLAAETIVVIDGARSTPRPPRSNENTDELRQLIPARFRCDPELIDALASFVGRRNDLAMARQRELARPLAGYFIRAWSLPANTKPELILCAIYDRATTDQLNERKSSQSALYKSQTLSISPSNSLLPSQSNDS